MRPTGRKRPSLRIVAATLVLVAASTLVGRGDAVDPPDGTMSLESGSGASVLDQVPHLPAISVGQARVTDNKGTPKLPPSAFAHLDIPVTALVAYQRAATVMQMVDEPCGLSWTLLAAIGRVESDHGRSAGAEPDRTSSGEIHGVALDGSGPLAMIRDTDAGQLDGDAVWDRAVGPMQFLPSTWSVVAVDADGDGVRSPDDLDDAALAAAVFLCSAPGDLDSDSGVRTAVFRYNPSSAYVADVLAVDRLYRAGEFDTSGGLESAAPVSTMLGGQFAELITVARGRADLLDEPDANQPTGMAAGPGPAATGPDLPDPGSAGITDPGPADTPGPGPTDTPDPGPTGTPDPGPTGTADPGPSETPHPGPADTPDPGPTGTPDPGPTGTPDPGPADTPDPGPPGTPDPGPTGTPDPGPADTPDLGPTGTPDPGPTGTPDPGPTGTPDPTETPDPPPDPDPGPVERTGVLAACGSGHWCLGELSLAVGDTGFLARAAASDFDGDGVAESNSEELTGLSGTRVSVLATPGTAPAVVQAINGAHLQ
jgi:hypothetical protein